MRICRNIENDRCFAFDPHLASQHWIEVIDIPGDAVPEILSKKDKESAKADTVNKAEVYNDGLDSLHWTQLKRKVEEAGGTWTSREAAIALLRMT